VIVTVTCTLAGLVAAPAGRADFTPFTLISGDAAVEADYAYEPAISADGRFVAFAGSIAGVSGLYRKDLHTGALDVVAYGDAAAPSISADGRYVSFTTTDADPSSASTTSGRICTSVYVRDMSAPIDATGAFVLASALDGTTTGLTYAGSTIFGCPGGGSAAAERVALSADGNEVAFTVVGESNLLTGPSGAPTTPGAQVVVRNIDTDATTLVSQTMASLGSTPQAVPGGAAMTDNSTGSGGNSDNDDSTVAISADGSTVAWLGIDIPSQAPAAANDAPTTYPNEYDEPLWRRIADGPSAPTRRVLGGDDPVGPCPGGCSGPLDLQWRGEFPPSPNEITGTDRGSLIAYTGFNGGTIASASSLAGGTPQLSADGFTVAVVSTQPATGEDPVCATCGSLSLVSTNAYLIDMHPGLGRAQALTRVTEWASNDFSKNDATAPIDDLAISPDGRRLAFDTLRTEFPFSPPALLTPPLSTVSRSQLYVVDLAAGTMELVSTGYDGQPANGNVVSPSFSADGGPIVFASGATNLAYGAASDISNGSEVFTTTEVQPPNTPGGQVIGPPPPNPILTPAWTLSATVHRIRNGDVVVDAVVPGPGKLRAVADLALPTAPVRTRSAGGRRGLRAGSTSGAERRRLASADTGSRGGVVAVVLRPATRYRAMIVRAHGLYAIVTVTFAAPGHRTLRRTFPVEFIPARGSRR
jgi:Tol biopolymer transport system component